MSEPKVSRAKRKANDKWDHENMITLGCKVFKADAAAFKEYAAQQKKTANALLKEYVYSCLEKWHQENN